MRFLKYGMRIVPVVLAMSSAVCSASAGGGHQAAAAPFETIKFPQAGKAVINASGVVAIADSRFVIIDNRTNDAVYELTVGANGESTGPLVRRPLTVKDGYQLEDMETVTLAETSKGRYLFISTSLSLKAGKKSKGTPPAVRPGGLIRVKWSDSGPLECEVLPNFREWLIKKYTKGGAATELEPDKGGLNVEGLAWDASRSALLVGVRSPVGDGVAYVAPVVLKSVDGDWEESNMEAAERLTIATGATAAPVGVRGIEYDAGRKAFLVLLGNAYSGGNAPFQLCLWDGTSPAIRKFEALVFAANSKPESVATGTVGGKPVIIIADDAGGYRVIANDDARLK